MVQGLVTDENESILKTTSFIFSLSIWFNHTGILLTQCIRLTLRRTLEIHKPFLICWPLEHSHLFTIPMATSLQSLSPVILIGISGRPSAYQVGLNEIFSVTTLCVRYIPVTSIPYSHLPLVLLSSTNPFPHSGLILSLSRATCVIMGLELPSEAWWAHCWVYNSRQRLIVSDSPAHLWTEGNAILRSLLCLEFSSLHHWPQYEELWHSTKFL